MGSLGTSGFRRGQGVAGPAAPLHGRRVPRVGPQDAGRRLGPSQSALRRWEWGRTAGRAKGRALTRHCGERRERGRSETGSRTAASSHRPRQDGLQRRSRPWHRNRKHLLSPHARTFCRPHPVRKSQGLGGKTRRPGGAAVKFPVAAALGLCLVGRTYLGRRVSGFSPQSL